MVKNDDRLVIIGNKGPQESGGLIVLDPQGKGQQQTSHARCDIVFVIDTTGSMDDKIEGLLSTCQEFVDKITKRQIDWQIAIVAFGDLTVDGDKIAATGFSHTVEIIKKTCAKFLETVVAATEANRLSKHWTEPWQFAAIASRRSRSSSSSPMSQRCKSNSHPRE